MSIPIYIFLGFYFIAIIVYVVISFFGLYHIFQFGFWDSSTKFMVTLHFVMTVLLLLSTGLALINVNWGSEISLFSDIEFRLNVI